MLFGWRSCSLCLFLLLAVLLIHLLSALPGSSLQPATSSRDQKRDLPTSVEDAEGSFLSCLKRRPNYAEQCGIIFKKVSLVGANSWAAPSCKAKHYSTGDLKTCLQNVKRTIVFAGNSRMRQLYSAMLNLINNQRSDTSNEREQQSLQFPYGNTRMEYFGLNFVGDMALNQVSKWLKASPKDRPDLLLLSVGTWYADRQLKLTGTEASTVFAEYQSKLRNLSRLLSELAKSTTVIWLSEAPIDRTSQPSDKRLSLIQEYNTATEAIVNEARLTFWSSAYDVAYSLFNQSPDNTHYSTNATDVLLDMLVNVYCNSKMNLSQEYCCSALNRAEEEQISPTARASFIIAVILVVVSMLYAGYQYMYSKQAPSISPALSMAIGVCSLATVIGLCCVFERLSVVPCEEKHYSFVNFGIPAIAILLVSCLSLSTSSQSSTLNRDQTDEWKGWMQLIIIIYHVTGASREPVVYMNLRFIVSSYLALNGYGNYMFYIRSGRPSWSRLLQIMLRLNLLTVLLCVTLNKPYQLYYFVPLVTFWYLFVCLTLSLPPNVTQKSLTENPKLYLILCCKLLLALGCISALHNYEGLFDSIFDAPFIRHLFVDSSGSLNFWRFRWSLDRFSSLFGVLLGMATGLIRDSLQMPRVLRHTLTAAAIVGVLVPTGLGIFCENKQRCNEIHSFVFFVPVVSFIYLRNITEVVRKHYSWIMASAGRMSLELFLLQFHIWLCMDTQRVLHILPWPFVNEAVLACALISASSVTQKATETIIEIAVTAMQGKKT